MQRTLRSAVQEAALAEGAEYIAIHLLGSPFDGSAITEGGVNSPRPWGHELQQITVQLS